MTPSVAPDVQAFNPAVDAYEALADEYDRFTTAHDHERWLAAIEAVAIRNGLRGRRVLDVACGTGKSFDPLLRRGYDVSACDVSPGMVRRAQARHPRGNARVWVADMRELPLGGPFDLVTCLDDAINYLLEPGDLVRAFGAVARLLAVGGLYLFDANTLRTYREAFGAHSISERDGRVFCWRGAGAPVELGGRFEAMLDVFAPEGDRFRRAVSRHVQRHHTRDSVLSALSIAGLELVEVLGQRTGAHLHPDPDELQDTKTLYVVRRAHERARVGGPRHIASIPGPIVAG